MPTETNNANSGGGVTIVKKPIPKKYQTFSFRRLLARGSSRGVERGVRRQGVSGSNSC